LSHESYAWCFSWGINKDFFTNYIFLFMYLFHPAFHFILTLQMSEFPNHKPENEDYNNPYLETAYFEGEDGELSWFNAGVRVGVGIGLSICLGIGIGVGLLVRTYQGTTSNFRRRL
jgi:hypothetical protein